MSKGPETTFIQAIHRLLPAALYRMKNINEYNGGIADCWYSGRRDLWVEYKFITLPKRATTMIQPFKELTPLQKDWLWERNAEGRSVWLVVGCPEGGAVFDVGEHMTPPWTADKFEHMSAKDWSSVMMSRRDIALDIASHCMDPQR